MNTELGWPCVNVARLADANKERPKLISSFWNSSKCEGFDLISWLWAYVYFFSCIPFSMWIFSIHVNWKALFCFFTAKAKYMGDSSSIVKRKKNLNWCCTSRMNTSDFWMKVWYFFFAWWIFKSYLFFVRDSF